MDDLQDDSPSSGDKNTLEVGKNADPLETYPPKLGHIMAAIHISIVQKCARMFMKGKPIKEEVTGGGMYINEVVASFLVKMTTFPLP